MLQKHLKWEVKAHSVEIQELLCHSNLSEFYFDKMLILKIAIFEIIHTVMDNDYLTSLFVKLLTNL